MYTIDLKFDRADNDNCRVYYTSDKGTLYCFQIRSCQKKTFDLFVCSRDGEPSHTPPIIVGSIEPARGDDTIVGDLNAFLALAS